MDTLELPGHRAKVHIVNIYSTGFLYEGRERRPLNGKLLLGDLASYYDLYQNQLPRLLPESFLAAMGANAVSRITLSREVAEVRHFATDAMLFSLPSNQVVLAVRVTFDSHGDDLIPTVVNVLEQGIEGKILLDGEELEKALERLGDIGGMEKEGEARPSDSALQPERHQLVFIRRSDEEEPVPDADTVRTVVYRTKPPLTEEFSRPKRPEQLNMFRAGRSGPGSEALKLRHLFRLEDPLRTSHESDVEQITLGVVTPYVSLFFGHAEYIEESVLLSSVHAVGTASKFRQIWSDTYDQVQLFRATKQARETGQQTLDSLEELADRLGNLEFDLTFSVEFPQLRIESFQAALYDAMDLATQANTLSLMFTQVASSVRSEITAIKVRERRQVDGRHKWNAFAAGLLSLAGVSVGLVIAFLGVNTREVPTDPPLSMWSAQFAGVYVTAGLFAIGTTYIIAFPYLRDLLKPRDLHDRRAIWTCLGLTILGVLLAGFAAAEAVAPVSTFLVGAGIFTLAAGASIAAMWSWYRFMLREKRGGSEAATSVVSRREKRR